MNTLRKTFNFYDFQDTIASYTITEDDIQSLHQNYNEFWNSTSEYLEDISLPIFLTDAIRYFNKVSKSHRKGVVKKIIPIDTYDECNDQIRICLKQLDKVNSFDHNDDLFYQFREHNVTNFLSMVALFYMYRDLFNKEIRKCYNQISEQVQILILYNIMIYKFGILNTQKDLDFLK